eukprot:CAMPEP_0182493722 /NCGR_PEP_ID=MMETSP1321-20130603/2642_1 /TAXON_ID=91990 /ORGANISM="Bolidomonas sp., Strain RCC1657" /LENGTH=394 /DNA_ID=CAMNT_0024696563 /DNA_START=288 /DNA_END=1472 /DNA_ORIENTATION=+
MGKEETTPENRPLESAENGKTNKRCIEGSKKLPAKGSSSNGDDVHEKVSSPAAEEKATSETVNVTEEKTKKLTRPRSDRMPILGKKTKLCKSCVRCRKRKVKCDSLKPSCSTCLRGGLTCAYLPARKRGPPNTKELIQRRVELAGGDFASALGTAMIPGVPYFGNVNMCTPPMVQPMSTPTVLSQAAISSSLAQLVLPNGEVTLLPILDYSNSLAGISVRVDGRGLNNDVLTGGRGLMSMAAVPAVVGVVPCPVGMAGMAGVPPVADYAVPGALHGNGVGESPQGHGQGQGQTGLQQIQQEQASAAVFQQAYAQQYAQMAQMQFAMQAQAAAVAAQQGSAQAAAVAQQATARQSTSSPLLPRVPPQTQSVQPPPVVPNSLETMPASAPPSNNVP